MAVVVGAAVDAVAMETPSLLAVVVVGFNGVPSPPLLLSKTKTISMDLTSTAYLVFVC